MKTITTGIIVFLAWAVFSNYWYVCKIKDLCGESVSDQFIVTDINTTPEEDVTESPADAENAASLVDFVETTVIYFPFDSSLVLNTDELNEVIQTLKEIEIASITLYGHTCDIGTEAYNDNLGERRAMSVSSRIKQSGIRPEKMDHISYGEARPAVANTSEANRKRNRRVEIDIETK
ncbi:MAG: OmpA family protein [Bacteroidota bacterium]